MIAVSEPDDKDVTSILSDVRFDDMAEWFAGTGATMAAALPEAIKESDLVRVAGDDLGPLIMWGASPGGRLWMFATNRAERKAVSLHRLLKPSMSELSERYGDLHCVADARNRSHLRWLAWLGFEELGEVDLPPFGLTFKVYVKDG